MKITNSAALLREIFMWVFYLQELFASYQVSPKHLAQGLQLERPTMTLYKALSRHSEGRNVMKQNPYYKNINGHNTQAKLRSGNHYYRYRAELGSRGVYDDIIKQSTKQRNPISSKEDNAGATNKCYAYLRGRRNIGPQTNFIPAKELTSGISKKTDRLMEVLRRISVTAMKEASKKVAQLYPVTGVNTEAFVDTKQSSLLKPGHESDHIERSPWTVHGNYKEPRKFRFHRTIQFPNIPSVNDRQNEHTSQTKKYVSFQYVPQTYKLKRQAPNNYLVQTNETAYDDTYLSLPYPYQDIHNSDSNYNPYQSNYNPHSQPHPSTYDYQAEYQSQPTYYATIPPTNPLRYQRVPYTIPATYPQNIPIIPSKIPLNQNTFQHYTLPQTLPQTNHLENSAGNTDTQQKETGYRSKDPSTDPEGKYVATSETFQDYVNQYPTGDLPKDNHPANEHYRYQDSGLDSDITLGTTTIQLERTGSPYSEREDKKVLSSQAPPSQRILSSETKVQSLNNKPESYVTGNTHLPLDGFKYHPVQENKLLMSIDDYENMPKTVLHSKTSNLEEERITHPPQVESAFTTREDNSDQQIQSPLTEYYTDQKKRELNVKSYYKNPSNDATSSDYLDIHHENNELNSQELRKLSLLLITTISPEETDSSSYTIRDLAHPRPITTQLSYPDEYLVNENTSIQKHEEFLGRETKESPPQDIYEKSSGDYQTRDTFEETMETSPPLSFTTNKLHPSSTEISNTGSHSPINIYKPPETLEILQTTSSPTETKQEESHLITTKSGPIISNYQENQIPPKQKSTARLSRSSAIKRHEIIPSSSSTIEPVVLNYTHSVVTNVESDQDAKSIHISSEYTEEISEITTVTKTTEPPQLSSNDKSQRLSLPVGAKNIVIKLPNGKDIIIGIASSAESSTRSIKLSSDTSTEDPFSAIDIRGLLSVSATGIANDSESSKHPILSAEPHIYSELQEIPNNAIISENQVIADNKILSETTISESHNLIQRSQSQTTTEIPSSNDDLHLVSTASQVSSIFPATASATHTVTLPLTTSEGSIATTLATAVFRAEHFEDNARIESTETVPSYLDTNYEQNSIANSRGLLYDSDNNVLTISVYGDRQKPEDVLKVNEDETDTSHNERIIYTYEIDDELVQAETPFSTVTEAIPTRLSDTTDSNGHIINRSNQNESPTLVGYLPPYLIKESSGKRLDPLNPDLGASALTDNNVEYDERESTGDKKERVFKFTGNCKCKCI
jgi:hypothetical protein